MLLIRTTTVEPALLVNWNRQPNASDGQMLLTHSQTTIIEEMSSDVMRTFFTLLYCTTMYAYTNETVAFVFRVCFSGCVDNSSSESCVLNEMRTMCKRIYIVNRIPT